jgi:hypothetical protein
MADFISKPRYQVDSNNVADFKRLLSELSLVAKSGVSETHLFFLPNKLEGLLEFLSYTCDADNLHRAQYCFKDAGFPIPADLNAFIYASGGSSSSQIFVPTALNDNTKQLILSYGGEFVEVQGWTIVLIANNVNNIGGTDMYSPLKVLEFIFDTTEGKYPAAISNSFAHTVYGKGHTFQKVGGISHVGKLSDLSIEPHYLEVIKDDIIWKTMMQTSLAFRENTVVIPRVSNKNAEKNMNGSLTEENSKIKNDWSDTVCAFDGVRSVVDIGGGKTNPGLEAGDAAAIMRSVHKELGDPAMGVAGCTGKIRTTVLSLKDSVENVEMMPFLMLKPEFLEKGVELLSVSGGEYYDKESATISVFVLKG